MSIPPTGRPGVILPGAPDPQQPTLHTCTDCGAQMLLPAGLVPAAAEHHRRGCLGPKVADLAERLTLISSQLHALLGALGDPPQDR